MNTTPTLFGTNLTSNWVPSYYYHPTARLEKSTAVGWTVKSGDPALYEWDALGHPTYIPPGGEVELRLGRFGRLPPGYNNAVALEVPAMPPCIITHAGYGSLPGLAWAPAGTQVTAPTRFDFNLTLNADVHIRLFGGANGETCDLSGFRMFFLEDEVAVRAGEISSLAMRRHLKGVPRIRDLDLGRGNFPDAKRAAGLPTFTMVGQYNKYHGLTPAEVIKLADECGVREVWLCLSAGTGWSPEGRAALFNAIKNSKLTRAWVQIGNEVHLGNGITNTNRHWYLHMAIQLWGEYVVPSTHDPADLTAQPGRIVRDSAIRWNNGLRWNHIRVLNDDLAAAGLPPVWAEGEAIHQVELLEQWALWSGLMFKGDTNTPLVVGTTEVLPVLGGHGGWGRASEILLKSGIIPKLGIPAWATPMNAVPPDARAVRDEALAFIRSYAIAAYPIFSDSSLRYQPGDENDPVRQAAQIAHLEGSLDRAFGALAEHKQRFETLAPWIKTSVYEYGLDIPSVTQDPNEPAHWSALTRTHPEAARMNQDLVDRIKNSGAEVAFKYHDVSYFVSRHGDWGALPDMASDPAGWALTAPGAPLAKEWAAEAPPVVVPPPVDPPDPQPNEREAIALELEALAVRVRAL